MLPGLLRNWLGEQEVKKHVQWSWPHKLKLITTELSVCDRQTILLTRCRNEEGKLCPRSNPFCCRLLWKSGWLQSFEEEKSKGNLKKKKPAPTISKYVTSLSRRKQLRGKWMSTDWVHELAWPARDMTCVRVRACACSWFWGVQSSAAEAWNFPTTSPALPHRVITWACVLPGFQGGRPDNGPNSFRVRLGRRRVYIFVRCSRSRRWWSRQHYIIHIVFHNHLSLLQKKKVLGLREVKRKHLIPRTRR